MSPSFAARLGWAYAALIALLLAFLGIFLVASTDLPLALVGSTLLAVLLLAIPLALWLAHILVAPLRAATERAERIAAEWEGSPAQYGPDELARLARALAQLSQHLEREASLRQQDRARLARILDRVADGVLFVGSDGRVDLLNTAAHRLLGLGNGTGSGRSLIELLPDHELVELARRCARAEPGADVEGHVTTLARPRRTLWTSVAPLGEPAHEQALLVLHDVTEVQRLEAVRREFVANVSHELRTPLASVKMLIETLQEGAIQDGALARDLLERTNVELDKLTQLVRELLQLSQIESGQQELRRERVDLGTLLERAAQRIRVQADHKHVALELAPIAADISVDVDPVRVEQVLINLLQNAITYTPPGGRVTLSAHRVDSEAVVSVADSGQGILSEDLPRLFERFYKADKARRTQGTGLGLAIAKHLVQAHGGRIWAESPGPRQGATFRFTLPVEARDAA